jgi:hypothetical protein
MRRSLIEWLFIAAVGMFLTMVALLALSLHHSWTTIPFDVAHIDGSGRVYVLIRDGKANLCNQIDFNSPGSPKPLIIDPRTMIFPKVAVNHQFSVPGLAFQFCRFAIGAPIWSLEFSLAIPAVFALITAIVLIRKLRRGRRPSGVVGGEHA